MGIDAESILFFMLRGFHLMARLAVPLAVCAALSMWGLSLTFLGVMSFTAAALFVGVALVSVFILSMSRTSADRSD